MSNPDILFRGIPRSPTRGYTAKVLADVKPKLVVIPCTGSFSLAHVAREAGVSGSQIIAGDISLYSTALGKAIMDQDWRLDLKPDAPHGELVKPYLTDSLSKAAIVMLMLRVCQYDKANQKHYHAHRQQELLRNAAVYFDELKAQIAALREELSGLRYVAQDMWLTMEQYLDDPGTVGLVNPPRYTGGYDRMFKGIDAIFDWDEPSASQFVEKDYARMMDMLAAKPALSLMYYATDGPDPVEEQHWGAPWRSVFADRPGTVGYSAINWIVANRNPIGVEASRARIHLGAARFPLFEGAITPDTDLRAMRIDKITGDFYRDLFIHKLPGSVTEIYVALLANGSLLGVIGLHLADLRRGKKIKKGEKVLDHCASVTFAFTKPHPLYGRLHKLTLMSLVSEWFWADVLGAESWYELNGAPKHVKTTMLTRHPENKTARGIMVLDTREPQKDGTYKLTYSAAVAQRTRQATIAEWLKKYADVTKPKSEDASK